MELSGLALGPFPLLKCSGIGSSWISSITSTIVPSCPLSINFWSCFWNPSKAITTQVTLSTVLRRAEVRRMASTECPQFLWVYSKSTFFSFSLFASIRTFCHAMCIVSLLDSLSKMPSQPITMKSWLSLISKAVTSGSAITTLGLPSYFGSLASISPIVFETLSLPGNTRCGPYTICLPASPSAGLVCKIYEF